jgi:hypothetical protein
MKGYEVRNVASVENQSEPAANIRNLLTPMLTLADMIKQGASKEFTEATADQVKINVGKILEMLDKL